jgi:hypothetical protein
MRMKNMQPHVRVLAAGTSPTLLLVGRPSTFPVQSGYTNQPTNCTVNQPNQQPTATRDLKGMLFFTVHAVHSNEWSVTAMLLF